MDFNPGKCEVLHFGGSNIKDKYTVNVQRDLGVQVHSFLKLATQIFSR